MPKFELPKLYAITDCRLSGLPHSAQVAEFIKGGARFIQLRDKHAAPREFLAQAEICVRIARRQSVKILINDRVDIAFAVGADGVHLGQTDLPPAAARQILGEKAIIGFSAHNLEQAAAAIKMPIDYVAAGPIFQTTTKENPEAVLGLENLRQIKSKIGSFPLVAIGGINKENARDVLNAGGANSVAVISALFQKPNQIAETIAAFNINL
jgi:thiamine-phosphate diphosphorylase